jgi:ABC-type phosphate/phosphonate transport system substrate-binding protein
MVYCLNSHAQNSTLTPVNAASTDNTTPTKISIGTPPWVSSNVAKLWSLHLDKFDYKHNLKFKLHSAKNYEEYILKSINHQFDALLAPAYMAAYLVKYHDFQVLCQGPYESDVHIITLNNSGISNIQQLENQNIGFPDPLSSSSLNTQQFFKKQNINYNAQFYGRHDQVVSAVLNRQTTAGVVVQQVLTNLKPVINGRLNSLHVINSKGTAFIISPRNIKPDIKNSIQETLLQSNSSQASFLPIWSAPSPQIMKAYYKQKHTLIEHLKLQIPIK